MGSTQGYPIILTADRTLMSEYGGAMFLGFSSALPKGLVPEWIYFSLLCPPIDVGEDGSVKVAPCGTRKVEAALLDHGFQRKDLAIVHPEYLDKAIGSNTKVVGITENDPLGFGPATSTFTQIFGGESYVTIKFREILNHPAINEFKPKIIIGGPGSWQLEDEEIRRKLGIDCVVIGEGEGVVGSLFETAWNGEELPEVVYGKAVTVDKIPVIKGATVNGIVEIARGCGRGCAFCAPTLRPYLCLPIEHILNEVEVNLRAGRNPLLHSEDVLRYKAKGLEVNKEAVIDLFKAVRNYPGVNTVGITHFALSSVATVPDVVEEISNILEVTKERWIGAETGIETGSPQLINKHMKGKCKPFRPEEWPDVVLNAFEILAENNWVPCATLLLGFPGETEEDLEQTISLVEKIKSFKSLIIPVFLLAIGRLKNNCSSFTLDQMTPKHSELLLECWKHNLNWASILNKESGIYTRKKLARLGLSIMFSFGLKQIRDLIRVCERDYGYDLKAMIKDFRSGGNVIQASLSIRLLKLIKRLLSV